METVCTTTRCGNCIGEIRNDGILYQGIPYATAERFEEPVIVTDFGGTVDATAVGPEFPQYRTYLDDSDRFYPKEFGWGTPGVFKESPLHLNIVTPKEANNCPVLIYIHGGGFFTGGYGRGPYGESFEYARRGIVLVSVEYRLNVFGLYMSGNYYLYDQLAAIHWVRDNIEAFGGNPEDLTLIGQSAGAMSIFQLLYTDVLKGLVKGAICMSGAGFFPTFGNGYTKKEGKWFWDEVMTGAGCSNLEQLKKVSPEKLWDAWWTAKRNHGSNLHILMPGVDGILIPTQPSEIRKRGEMLDIPMMVGVTSQDMMVPVIIFQMAVDFALWSEKHREEPVYLYYFDRVLPGNLYKAYHASDLWYVFGGMENSWRPFGKEDELLRDTMIDAVVRFVRTGNPGWEPFTRKNRKIRHFNTVGPDFVTPAQCYGELINNSIFTRGPF